MHRMLLLCCLLCVISGWCRPAAFDGYPARLTPGELTADWSIVRIPAGGDGALEHYLRQVAPGMPLPDAHAAYTRGQVVDIAGRVYLVVYRPERKAPSDREGMKFMLTVLTPETPLFPTLINLRDVTAISYAGPFELQREIRAGARRYLALARLHSEGSNEAVVSANLQALRQAIAQFRTDTGADPARLADLVRPPDNAPATGLDDDGKPLAIKPGAYRGPYLDARVGVPEAPGIPLNPYVDPDLERPDPTLVDTHWLYRRGLVGVPDYLFGIFMSNGRMLGEL